MTQIRNGLPLARFAPGMTPARRQDCTRDAGMKPLTTGEADAWLEKLELTMRAADGVGASAAIPVAAEGNACMAMWHPTWRERLRVAFGAPIRVLLNYSLHGPLHVDTEAGAGAPSRD
jgi:hypothetical protein